MQVQNAEKDVRGCGNENSAMQRFSPDQPFDGVITWRIQTDHSLRSVSTIETRDYCEFAALAPMAALARVWRGKRQQPLVPHQNLKSWRPIIDALDQLASPRVVERALRSTGLSRGVLEGQPIFIPCALQAAFVENVSRQLGERHLGPLLASQFGYAGLDIYADYVLDASRLDIAFERGVRALPFLQSGASVNICDAGDKVVLQFGSGIQSVVGAQVRNLTGGEFTQRELFCPSPQARHFQCCKRGIR